jgi:energy-coupling factor transport system permease protein
MNYFSRNTYSPFGKLDVRIKMAIGFAISVLVVLVDTLTSLSTCAVIGLLCFILCFPNRKQIVLVSVTTIMIVWGLMFSQGLFYAMEPRYAVITLLEPNPIFKYGLKIYAQGLQYGSIQSFRIIAATLTGFAICFSTESDQFLKGLLAVKIPFSLSFMAVSAIRFIPVVAQEIGTVRNAMQLKGYRPFKCGLKDTVNSEISALRPILAGTIRRSEEIALSIQTRGFSMDAKRSSWIERHFSFYEKLSLLGMLAIMTVIITCKLLFWMYQWEFFYLAQLRPLYGFVRTWL